MTNKTYLTTHSTNCLLPESNLSTAGINNVKSNSRLLLSVKNWPRLSSPITSFNLKPSQTPNKCKNSTNNTKLLGKLSMSQNTNSRTDKWRLLNYRKSIGTQVCSSMNLPYITNPPYKHSRIN